MGVQFGALGIQFGAQHFCGEQLQHKMPALHLSLAFNFNKKHDFQCSNDLRMSAALQTCSAYA